MKEALKLKASTPYKRKAYSAYCSLMQLYGNYFTIDASPLKKPARKPKYLERRFENKSKSFFDVEMGLARKEAFLNARRSRLGKRLMHIKDSVMKAKELEDERKSKTKSLIAVTLENANKKRAMILQQTIDCNSKYVKRAKEMAKINAQKIIRDKLTLQLQIDARMRLSSYRREKFLSIPRSQVLGNPLADLKIADNAAVQIQNYYRKRKFDQLVKVYRKVGLTKEQASSYTFDELIVRVQNPTTVKVAGYFVSRAKKINGSTLVFKTPGKYLLSAFVFTTYPSEVLLKKDLEETELLAHAENLVSSFSVWKESTDSALIAPLSKMFLEAFETFYKAFDNYKSRDKIKFLNQLVGHFMELDKLWLNVMFRQDAHTEWAAHINEHQAIHLAKILMFGELGISALKKARDEFVKENRQAVELNIAATFSTFATEYYLVNQLKEVKADSLSNTVNEDLAANVQNNPNFAQFLSNEQLAHELVMDPNFELKREQKSQVELHVENIVKKAYQDKIRQELSEGISSKSVLGLVMEIKQGLQAMLSEKGDISSEIEQVLEKEFLEQQISNNVFSLEKIAAYVGEKMLQLCAPVRDESIRAVQHETDIVIALFKLLDIIEDMRLDLANFRLAPIRPHLIQQAVQYEIAKFDSALDNNQIRLDNVKVWLNESASSLREKDQNRNPENIESEGNLTFASVFNNAIISTLFSKTPINPNELPETFMDQKRIFEFQNELQAITIVSSLTTLSENILPVFRSDVSALKDLGEQLFELLESSDTKISTLSDKIISCANELLHRKEKLKEVSEEEVQLVSAMVDKTISLQDPFFGILSGRLEKITRLSIEKDVSADIIKKHGFEVVLDKVLVLMTKISTFVKYNKKVYGKHYDEILKSILEN